MAEFGEITGLTGEDLAGRASLAAGLASVDMVTMEAAAIRTEVGPAMAAVGTGEATPEAVAGATAEAATGKPYSRLRNFTVASVRD